MAENPKRRLYAAQAESSVRPGRGTLATTIYQGNLGLTVPTMANPQWRSTWHLSSNKSAGAKSGGRQTTGGDIRLPRFYGTGGASFTGGGPGRSCDTPDKCNSELVVNGGPGDTQECKASEESVITRGAITTGIFSAIGGWLGYTWYGTVFLLLGAGTTVSVAKSCVHYFFFRRGVGYTLNRCCIMLPITTSFCIQLSDKLSVVYINICFAMLAVNNTRITTKCIIMVLAVLLMAMKKVRKASTIVAPACIILCRVHAIE